MVLLTRKDFAHEVRRLSDQFSDRKRCELNSALFEEDERRNRSRIAVILFGLFSLIAGIVFSTIPWVDYMILEHLNLWNGSLSFHYWQKPGVTRLTKVYIFNVTNPDGLERLPQLPLLAETWRHETHQSLHLQRDQPGRLPQSRRETQTPRSGSVRL
ncbi:CD36 family [Popillia japonica]|uniref:CD36 family n=1 Tax=Popillia japonica TaxID=7064 RepID=A0AAW1N4K0_POPJA